MSNDLLPEWLNLLLDDVETNLCLPILLVMVLCTIQFIINHMVDIGCTIYQNINQSSSEDDESIEKEPGESLMDKIKAFVCNLAFKSDSNNLRNTECTAPLRPNAREEEWDYCEEDDD
ncbi:uncharacterized protein LOC114879928 [Osmia bicornis bicornis]|uniref:uncharacterized protein LOC114879928 n=1 Tax=Osmia bicornis bicornis TaxID=1437191 RepID=UPI0010F6F627|nr:uncharacterized protein LOC114879928 [Osmia bicornis bicornis]